MLNNRNKENDGIIENVSKAQNLFYEASLIYSLKICETSEQIINVLEKYEEFNVSAQNEINADLRNVGYKATTSNQCDSDRVKNHLREIGITNSSELTNLNTNAFNYCLYKIESKSSHGSFYYVAVTFVSFEFPLIGDILTFPVYGETRILGKDYNY